MPKNLLLKSDQRPSIPLFPIPIRYWYFPDLQIRYWYNTDTQLVWNFDTDTDIDTTQSQKSIPLLMLSYKALILNLIPYFCLKHPLFDRILWKLLFCLAFAGLFSHFKRTDTNLDTWGEKRWYRYWYRYFLDWNFDTDTDMILSYSQILILIRYWYDTFLQKSRNFDTDTIVSKGSALNVTGGSRSLTISLAKVQTDGKKADFWGWLTLYVRK